MNLNRPSNVGIVPAFNCFLRVVSGTRIDSDIDRLLFPAPIFPLFRSLTL